MYVQVRIQRQLSINDGIIVSVSYSYKLVHSYVATSCSLLKCQVPNSTCENDQQQPLPFQETSQLNYIQFYD